jgi:hypothetical protein
MNLNLSQFNKGFVIGSLTSSITSLSVGLLVYFGREWVPLQPEASLQEEEEEMKRWSSSMRDPSHKDFNPFKWNHTPDEFGYKK